MAEKTDSGSQQQCESSKTSVAFFSVSRSSHRDPRRTELIYHGPYRGETITTTLSIVDGPKVTPVENGRHRRSAAAAGRRENYPRKLCQSPAAVGRCRRFVRCGTTGQCRNLHAPRVGHVRYPSAGC